MYTRISLSYTYLSFKTSPIARVKEFECRYYLFEYNPLLCLTELSLPRMENGVLLLIYIYNRLPFDYGFPVTTSVLSCS